MSKNAAVIIILICAIASTASMIIYHTDPLKITYSFIQPFILITSIGLAPLAFATTLAKPNKSGNFALTIACILITVLSIYSHRNGDVWFAVIVPMFQVIMLMLTGLVLNIYRRAASYWDDY